MLPADSHVHSEWSWDAPLGSMRLTCQRAVDLGLAAVAFTEHADYSPWIVRPGELDGFPYLQAYAADGVVTPPKIDVPGYLECLQQCRERFPSLRIISGLEIGEPHWHREEVAGLLAAGPF